jgi:hypothetical protein
MTIHFAAELQPADDVFQQVAALAPGNPFYTPGYLRARQALGAQVWVAGLRQGQDWLAACPLLIRQGRWHRSLELESLPVLPQVDVFWDGWQRLCGQHGITQGEIGTYASLPVTIPSLRGETERHERCEHLLFLKEDDLLKQTSSHHKRNIKRGAKAGLQLRCVTDAQACQVHARLIGQSLERRRERGETVAGDMDTREYEAYLQCGAGQLFQAALADTARARRRIQGSAQRHLDRA